MSKGDKFLLVLPAAGVFVIAVAMLLGSYIIQRQNFDGSSSQAFEKFVSDLKTRQVTPDEWIRYIRAAHNVDQSCRANAVKAIEFFRWWAWSALAITVIQTILVFSVSTRYRQSTKTTPA